MKNKLKYRAKRGSAIFKFHLITKGLPTWTALYLILAIFSSLTKTKIRIIPLSDRI